MNIEMTPGEAIIVQGVLSEHAAGGYRVWRRLMETNAPADEQEAVKVATDIVNRVAVRIANTLYPPCDWLEECDTAPAEGSRYCRFHTDALARTKAEAFA